MSFHFMYFVIIYVKFLLTMHITYRKFDAKMNQECPGLTDEELQKLREQRFVGWLKDNVRAKY